VIEAAHEFFLANPNLDINRARELLT